MGVSNQRKKDHKFDLVGEKRHYKMENCDYTKLRNKKQKLAKGQKTLI